MRKSGLILVTLSLILSACSSTPTTSEYSSEKTSSVEESRTSESISTSSEEEVEGGTDFHPEVTLKELDKDVYVNKTLGGLLGQFAGFLSGYEFARWNNMTGYDESWFDFINGPYAGNYKYFTPPDSGRYDRLRDDPQTGLSAVWSDDDFHIDILNQYVLKELGCSSFAIKETWKKYIVNDWGGGYDAMSLINSKNLLAPFTGSIEAGNRYGWCTEGYIENETLGMNAPGMPNIATFLTDKFASNVAYFDSINWGKFFSAMYSLAYFEDDVRVIMEEAKELLPENSYPYKIYNYALDIYSRYPNDYKSGAAEMETYRRNLYRLDNVQTDPNVNGGLSILSWLYGENDYMKTAKYSSIMGYDGDCTAAICCGLMGVLKGFKEKNEEYQKINEKLYHDGEGVYHNDVETDYTARILGANYPTNQKIDDIVRMYQDNFETILLANGGRIESDKYIIPTTKLIKSHSYLFTNYDAEERDISGFEYKGGELACLTETDNENSHTGFAYFELFNHEDAEAYHTYDLVKGKEYRLTTLAKTSPMTQVSLFARGNNEIVEECSFSSISSIIVKSFSFIANSNKMDVGFMFKGKGEDEYVIFDDFMLEEINTPLIATVTTQNLTLSSNKYMKSISRPASVNIGQEVLLCVEYRTSSSAPIFASLNRNGEPYGGFIFSTVSKNGTSGRAVVEIPYIFEKDLDTIQLVFNNMKVYIGKITLKEVGQYMFR